MKIEPVAKALSMLRVIQFMIFALLALLWSPDCGSAQEPPSSLVRAADVQANQQTTTPATEVSLNDRLAEQAWMKLIDQFFADFLVEPLESVLMFDLSFGYFVKSQDENPLTKPGLPFVVIWLFVGAIYLTFRMRFISVRAFWHAIQLVSGKYDNPNEPGEVSHFAALSSALSGTVGLGNISGVAIAVGLGGPGATFWMIVMGLLGMASKFSECTLAMLYRKIDDQGRVLGGPMLYLKQGLTDLKMPIFGSFLSVLFAVLCVGASLGGGNAFQVGQSLGVLQEAEGLTFLKDYPYLYGLAMSLTVGLVIIGGIRWIGAVSSKVVPFMCLLYGAATLYIIGTHLDKLPNAMYRIVAEAFTPNAAIVGSAISVMIFGIRRAAFSNEAGIGSAAIAHSAAKTDEPVSEGIVALLEPFIDTVVVCTLTALAIVITGAFETDAGRTLSQANNGAALTRLAFLEGGHHWTLYVLYISVILFAYATCISWFYYGERSFVYLFGESKSIIFKLLFMLFTLLGSIVSRGNILNFSDYMILAMAVPNLIGVYLMSPLIYSSLQQYWKRYKSGQLEPSVKYKTPM